MNYAVYRQKENNTNYKIPICVILDAENLDHASRVFSLFGGYRGYPESTFFAFEEVIGELPKKTKLGEFHCKIYKGENGN